MSFSALDPIVLWGLVLGAALCLLALIPVVLPSASRIRSARPLRVAALFGALLGLMFPITATIALLIAWRRVPTMSQVAFPPLALGAVVVALAIAAPIAGVIAASGAALSVRATSALVPVDRESRLPGRFLTFLVAATPALLLCGPLLLQQYIYSGYEVRTQEFGGCALFLIHVSLAAAAPALWASRRPTQSKAG